MKNYNITRKRPVVNLSILQEHKDLLDTVASITGASRTTVVDNLVAFFCHHHTVGELVAFMEKHS